MEGKMVSKNPLEDLVVAKGTTLGNATSPLFVIQTELKTYLASSLQDCRRTLRSHGDTSPILAAGPASYDLRVHVARVFDMIGFFGNGEDDAA
jgi:hypothetical protein